MPAMDAATEWDAFFERSPRLAAIAESMSEEIPSTRTVTRSTWTAEKSTRVRACRDFNGNRYGIDYSAAWLPPRKATVVFPRLKNWQGFWLNHLKMPLNRRLAGF